MLQDITHADSGKSREVEGSEGCLWVLVDPVYGLPECRLQLFEVVDLAKVLLVSLRKAKRCLILAHVTRLFQGLFYFLEVAVTLALTL